MEQFYTSIGHPQAYAVAKRKESGNPLLDVLACLTTREAKGFATPHELFETLSQLRAKASAGRQGGIYVDRRGVNG